MFVIQTYTYDNKYTYVSNELINKQYFDVLNSNIISDIDQLL